MATTDDFAAHRATYDAMLRVLKMAVPAIAVIAALVVYLISH